MSRKETVAMSVFPVDQLFTAPAVRPETM
jgi:hypothetical protein